MSKQPYTESTTPPSDSPSAGEAQIIHGDVIGRDKVEGDKTTIGDIQKSAVAVGDGAQAILQIIERALTAVEVADQAEKQAQQRLGEAIVIYVQSLAKQAARAQTQVARLNPYKALLSYDLQDAPLFFGRAENCDELERVVNQGRLTVLYAESGAGKTSLLRAGLMSRLVARESIPVYLRPRDVPVPLGLKRFMLPALDETLVLADDSLRDFLWRATRLLPGRELVVLVDQFEDVFDSQKEEARADFGKQLAECLDDDTLRVRWVLALRQEYFVRLGEFRQIKEPFGNVVRLPRMTREQAQEVIVEPSRLQGITWEQAVVDRVLAELATGDKGILPVQLQLVCSELFQRAGQDGAITLAAYKAAGSVKGMLGSYLNNVLDRQMTPGQGEVALRLLENLAASEPEMRLGKEALAELMHGDTPDGTVTDEVLKQLQDAFLVRIEVADGSEMVELSHRYLLNELKPDVEVRETVAARQLLDRGVRDYEASKEKVLLDADRLAIIEAQWDRLNVGKDTPAAELRQKSTDRLKRQRGYVRLGIGAVLILAVAALLSIVGLGVARTETRNSEATAQAAQAEATDAHVVAIAAETAAADARVVAVAADATAQVAEAAAANARATQTVAETAAADAEARAEIAADTLRRAFQQTGVVPVGEKPTDLAWDGNSLWVANVYSDTVQQIDPSKGTVVATIAVGDGPYALAWDGSNLWVANVYSDTVQQIDPDRAAVVATIAVGDDPAALAWDGSSLWVANSAGNTVQQIDPATGAVVAPISVGDTPVALAWDGSHLWVANSFDNTVQQIDPITRAVGEPILVGKRPVSLAWDGSSLWVANLLAGTIQGVNPTTGVIGEQIDVGYLPEALAWDGSSLWVANGNDNTVQQVDPTTENVGTPISVGNEPQALTWDGSSLWVANGNDNTVQQINPAIGVVGAPISVGDGPQALAWDGSSLWVANHVEDTVEQIDSTTGAVGAPINVGDGPQALAWDGSSLWVANGNDNTIQQIDPVTRAAGAPISVGDWPIALAWDGGSLWVANGNDNTIQQIDPVTRLAEAPIRVGVRPEALVWDGSSLWVANYEDDTIQQVNPATGIARAPIRVGDGPRALAWDGSSLWVANSFDNSVQQIDPTTGAVGEPFLVGKGPVSLAWDGSSLWVANREDYTIQQIVPGTGAVGPSISVGRRGPTALVSDGNHLWVADYYDSTVWQINAWRLSLVWQAQRLAEEAGAP